MAVASAVAAAAAAAGINLVLPPVIKKLVSKLGGDVTPAEMETKKIVVSCLIEELIRKVKHDDSDKSKQLLKKLQAASLELAHLFDIYEYDQLEKQVSSSSNPIRKLIPISKQMLGPILPKSPLRDRLEKLLEFLEQVEKLEQLITSRTDTAQPQADTIIPTTSTFSPPYFGRVDQCKGIIDFLLLDSHANKIPVIAITGIAGCGKTHTAKHICNNDKIKNHFDANMWVHVTRDLDVVGLTRQMLESAINDGHNQITSLEVLQRKLIKSFSNGKKYLFVFDDVWCEDITTWDKLVGPLNEAAGNGSKIIITTRSEDKAQMLGAEIVQLGKLDDRDCWSIIKNYAFPNSQKIDENKGLSYVKNEIISKVKESPLALRAMASSSITKGSVDEWMKKLKQVTLEVTMKFLNHSYNNLPSHLKLCFAYCSLFPKGYKFYIDFHKQEPHLISLWIAQGYIENTGELTLEEAGKNYIEELVSQSFFEKESKDYFVIPDLLHDLAEKFSKDICHRVEDHGSLNIPAGCIHLSFCSTENFVSSSISVMKARISKLTNLQTLIILRGPVPDDIFQNGEGILPKLINLHALYIHPDQLMGVQSIHRIDELKLLRYLHVQYGKRLPDALAKLYLLKIFILITDQDQDQVNDSKYLKKDTLPKNFDKLISLRTLKFYASCGNELDYLYHNSEMIDVSKLIFLQNLMAFHPDKNGSKGMMALRNLSLCGSLSVLNLENVQSKEEAGLATLNQKKSLNELIFEWSSTSSDNSNKCAEVLEGLKPHDNLKKLEIVGYQSVTFPDWMIRLPRLEILTLRPCTIHEIVSSFPPHPQSLHICDYDKLMQLSFVGETGHTLILYDIPKSALPSMFNRSLGLRRLTIRGCSIDDIDLSSLTNLEYLDLIELPNLQTITNLSPTLAKLSIVDCSKLSSVGNLQGCTSLEWLTIYKCPMLRREPSLVEGGVEADIANRLPQVKYVYTDELLLVHELVQQQAFSSIAHLTLKDSVALPNLEILSSLKNLCIEDCPDVESLPNLPVSLRSLWIENCRDVESLPNLPFSLQLLWIDECPKLKERYGEGGPLLNTISHIPLINIR